MVSFNFPAIGTDWQIDIFQEISKENESALLSTILKRIDIFDKTYSRFRADSLITQISLSEGEFVFPEDSREIFSLYYDLYLLTDGLFTPFVGQVLVDAGYDAKYSLVQNKKLEIPPLWDQVIRYNNLVLDVKKPIILDFGAGGKGYLVDIVAGVIEKFGIEKYCIDAGGDILHKGPNPIKVGLEHPLNFDEAVGIYELSNGSLCGSAHNRRSWGEFSHIINPATLTSPREILSVWVFAKTAIIADSVATCLFFCSPRKILKKYSFEYLILKEDLSIEKSSGFNAEMFLKNNTYEKE